MGRAHSKPPCSNRGPSAPETSSSPWFNTLLFAILKFLIFHFAVDPENCMGGSDCQRVLAAGSPGLGVN